MKAQVQIRGQIVELDIRCRFVSDTLPEMMTRALCCQVTRPATPPTASNDDLSASLRLQVPGLPEPLVGSPAPTYTDERVILFFGSQEFSRASTLPRLEVLWQDGERATPLGSVDVDNDVAHVYWNGRLAGVLLLTAIDQPRYHGIWSTAHDPDFDQAYRAMQTNIAPDGLGMLPVTFRSLDGKMSTPARAMVRPAPETAPYFRWGFPDEVACVVNPSSRIADDLALWHKHREEMEFLNSRREATSSTCQGCGRPISPDRLQQVPSATRCWDCQMQAEKAEDKELSPTPSSNDRWWRWW